MFNNLGWVPITTVDVMYARQRYALSILSMVIIYIADCT